MTPGDVSSGEGPSDYWGPVPVFVPCHGADTAAVEVVTGGRSRCLGCSAVFDAADLDPDPDGGNRRFPPAHRRQVPADEQARSTLTHVAELIGLDPRHPAVEQSLWLATTSSGASRPLHDMVSSGLCELARALTVSGSRAGAARDLDEFAAFRIEGDPAPFFSEATLYPLVGKDTGRSLLALLAAAQRSMGPASGAGPADDAPGGHAGR